MNNTINKNRLLNILLVFALIPFVIIFILPKDYSVWWWNVIVIVTFISGLLFCAFVDDGYWREKQKHYTSKINLFGRKIIIFNLSSIIIAPVPILFLIEYKNVLSTANTIAVITTLIILFKIFKIKVSAASRTSECIGSPDG